MGGSSSKESEVDVVNEENTTILDRGMRKTTKKNFNNFGGKKTQAPNSTVALDQSLSTVLPEAASTVINTTPKLINTSTVTRTRTNTKTTATSESGKDHGSENSGTSSWLHGGIIVGIILAIIILIIFIKKNNKKRKENDTIPTYQTLNNNKTLKPTPPKTSDSDMYSGPIYDPSKENDYSTMDYNNATPSMDYNNNATPSMGVATSVDAATIQRKNEEIEAAKAAFSHATLPNFNSVQKQDSSASLPEITGAQSFNYGQQNYSQIQPQPSYDSSYNQQPAYSQPQPAYNPAGYNQPQQAYDPAGFNQPQTAYNAGGYNQPQSFDSNGYNSVTNSPYGAQYANNYTPGTTSVDQSTVTSPLALPVSPAGGVIVSATYSSSQTTSVKQPDGTVTETVDFSTTNSYEVDKDYVAIYSYEPNMTDELTININDRIHLLEMYSDGWGYGKNVTTGQIGILPLNRLKIEDEKEKNDPIEELRKKNHLTVDISKRTVSRYRKPKKDDYDDKKKSKKRYSDEDDDYDRKRYSDDDDYERRRERRRHDDDDYERRRERRRHEDDDYERRRDRRRYSDDDDDYERRRDRRRYSDDDDYERRRDRRRYSDEDDHERRRDRRRYSDDDYDKKERRRSNSNERKSIQDRDVEKKTSEDKDNKKSEDESKKSDDNGIVEYEIKSYRKD